MKSQAITVDILREELKHLEERVDEKARGYRDDILNKMDETMGELEGHRIEHTSWIRKNTNLFSKRGVW